MSFSMCAIRMKALSMGTVSDEGHFHIDLQDNNIEEECIANSKLEGGRVRETVVIEKAVKVLLQGLGEDVSREGLRKTPLRVAKALLEGTRGYNQKVKDIVQDALFPEAGLKRGIGNAGGSGGLVIVRDLHLFSYCASCLLPFHVKCHVGYIPSYNRVLGLSKLSRVADVFAKRLQNPQRLADQVCAALHEGISPSGVAVLLQCSHIHFPGENDYANHKGWVIEQAISGSGIFGNENADIWGDFTSLLKFRGVIVNPEKRRKITHIGGDNWCPSQSNIGLTDSTMIMAVDSILRALGEDPTREELLGTPARFVKWLKNFKTYNVEMKFDNGVVGAMNGSSNNNNYDELVVCSEMSIPFWSQCEHHLLPFHGVVHIGYLCGNGVNRIGKQVLQSIVHFHGFKLQVQERLNRQIAEVVASLIGVGDVIVVIEASHTCMITRGIEKFGSSTATVAVLGRFSTDSRARGEFLESIPKFDTSSSSAA